MKSYLVGGAVRDSALGLEVADRDWVVVGATPDDMLAAGYRQVGKDFPVFLHPETNEEFALARTERKAGRGHHGFDIDAGTHVTLDQDLSRRDLTINAMAQDSSGQLIDPWGGDHDLRSRVLRHVSPAFEDDPLRVLRVARFAARLAPFGFRVAPQTLTLMQKMASSGELATLPAERVQQEMAKALATDSPHVFFDTLRDCDALARVWPELDSLFGESNTAAESTTASELALQALTRACALGASVAARFATLCQGLESNPAPNGKATGAKEHSSQNGESNGESMIETSCARLKVPKAWRELALISARHRHTCQRADSLSAVELVDALTALDAIRRAARFDDVLLVYQATERGDASAMAAPYPQAKRLRAAVAAMRAVDAGALLRDTPADQRQALIRHARIEAVRDIS